MADTVADTKETVAGTPEKKEVEKVEQTDEDSKASENGLEKLKENGTTDEKEGAGDSKDSETTENGESTDSAEVGAKRKSEGGDAPDGTLPEGVSPEKKAKLEEKAEAQAPTENGEAEAVA